MQVIRPGASSSVRWRFAVGSTATDAGFSMPCGTAASTTETLLKMWIPDVGGGGEAMVRLILLCEGKMENVRRRLYDCNGG